MTVSASAHRAIARFRCLQDRCEDTCCAGLTIPVDAAAEARFAREGLGDGIVDGDGQRVLAKGADGGCHFLAGGRCGVQLRFGEAALPSACAMFPRKVRAADDRLEITGSLACPEMVRLSLCEEDGLEWEPFDLAQLPRSVDETFRPGEHVPGPAALLDAPFPLGSRLAMLAQLAFVLESEPDRSMVLSELQCAAIDHNFSSLTLPLDGVNESLDALLAEVLESKRSNPGAARFVRWADEVMAASTIPLAHAESERLEVLLTRRARYAIDPFPVVGSPLRSIGPVLLRLALIGRAARRATEGSIDERFTRATQLLAKHVEASPAIATLERVLFEGDPQRVMFGCWLLAKTLAP